MIQSIPLTAKQRVNLAALHLEAERARERVNHYFAAICHAASLDGGNLVGIEEDGVLVEVPDRVAPEGQ